MYYLLLQLLLSNMVLSVGKLTAKINSRAIVCLGLIPGPLWFFSSSQQLYATFMSGEVKYVD